MMLVWCNINICDLILSVKSSFYLSSRRGGMRSRLFYCIKKTVQFLCSRGEGDPGNG